MPKETSEQRSQRKEAESLFDKANQAEKKQELTQAHQHLNQALTLYQKLDQAGFDHTTRVKLIQAKLKKLQKSLSTEPEAKRYETDILKPSNSKLSPNQATATNPAPNPTSPAISQPTAQAKSMGASQAPFLSAPAAKDSTKYHLSDAISRILDKTKIHDQDIQLEKKLGNGAFGTVHKAKWQGSDVVVKQLTSSELTQEEMTDFIDEAKMMYCLKHPKIVEFYGLTDGTQPALVIEYAPNGTLRDFYQSKTPKQISWSVRIQMGKDVASALHYLHSQKQPIIHGDIKSDNVLLFENNTAKITDFGLSVIKKNNDAETALNSKKEKMLAMLSTSPPELLSGEGHSPATDIYSFGVLLWEMATHQPPFKGYLRRTMIQAINQGKREALPADTPTHYQKLTEQAYHLNPHQRPTATQALNSLETTSIPPNQLTAQLQTLQGSQKAQNQLSPQHPQNPPNNNPAAIHYEGTNVVYRNVSKPSANPPQAKSAEPVIQYRQVAPSGQVSQAAPGAPTAFYQDNTDLVRMKSRNAESTSLPYQDNTESVKIKSFKK